MTRRFPAMHGMSEKCGDKASCENKQENLKQVFSTCTAIGLGPICRIAKFR